MFRPKHFFFSCFLLLLSHLTIAQNNIDLSSLPPVSDLAVTMSNPSADTVVIGMHGGPSDMLYTGDFSYFYNVPTFSVVEVKQYQHYNSSILDNSAMTLNQGITYNDTTVAMLQKVVKHYTNLGKTVVLIGHSFGAFILCEYVDDYGMDDVHRVIPMAGRINMNNTVWQNIANGYFADFAADGVTVNVDNNKSPSSMWATMKLMAGMGYNRWTDSLSSLNLSSLMYVYGTNDEAVGSLLPPEVTMLNNASARVLKIQGGNHGSPFANTNMKQVLDFIRESILTNTHQTKPTIATVRMFPTIVKNHLNIDAEKEGTLSIINANGQLVQSTKHSSGYHQIALNDLVKGFYIATYITIDQERMSYKIIVQ